MKQAENNGVTNSDNKLIPEDWEVKTLGELCVSIIDGTHQTPRYVNNGVPFYSVENITENNFLKVKKITEEAYNRYNQRCNPEKGDILLTRIGTLGKTKLINWDVKASIYVSLALLKFKKEFNVEYIYCYTKSRKFVNDVKRNSLINAVPQKINLKDISKVPIVIPKSREEQQKIGSVLMNMDELIESLEKIIDKKKKVKLGTMQQLLTGKKRLPGFTEEWEEVLLGEIMTLTTGKLDANAMVKRGKYRFYTCAKEYYYINNYAFDGEALLVSGNGAHVGYVHYYKGKFNAYQRTYVLMNFVKEIKYIKYYLDFYLKKWIEVEVNAGGTPFIKRTTLTDMPINIPKSTREQQAIASILIDMDAEIELLERKLSKYKKIKEGMMQQLLTGRVRLV